MKPKNSLKKAVGVILIIIGIITLIVGILLFMFSTNGSILWTIIISVILNVVGINVLTHKSKAE